MKYYLTILLIFYILSGFNAQTYTELSTKIEAIANEAINDKGMPGLSIAVVKNGQILHHQNYGLANIEHQVPLSNRSIFRVYSITKIFVAVGIMQLVESDKLSLSDPLSNFDLPIPSKWQDRTIQHLLTHSSGFPDMAPIPEFQELTEEEALEKIKNQTLQFKKGHSYRYNQTNFYLLQKIIEQITKQNFSEYILRNQFYTEDEEAFFSSDSRTIIKDRVTPYFPFATGKMIIEHPYLQGDYFAACNGMNLSMNAFINWDKKFSNNQFISPTVKKLMFSEFDYTESEKIFAFGWNKIILNNYESYGFTGSLVTAYRIFPSEKLSIIVLGNGLGKLFDIDEVVNQIANAVNPDIIDYEKVLTDSLLELAISGDSLSFQSTFSNLIKNKSFERIPFESIGNRIGYHLLGENRSEEAITVFIENVKNFPDSWNAYDSLGEAYMRSGDKAKSIVNYKKSLALNPDNQHGIRALQQLEGK